MKKSLQLIVAGVLVLTAGWVLAADKESKAVPKALNFKMKSLAGKDVDLSKYQGKVVLMVNVASQCGLTPQYEGLEALHEKYAEQGLAVLGFPANDFGAQEPGTDSEIATFCEKNYGVKFDMFSKITVKGANKHPLYQYLTAQETAPAKTGEVSWNFEKFLVDRHGNVVGRFAPKTDPNDPKLVEAIETALKAK